jgi:hypothetical protein
MESLKTNGTISILAIAHDAGGAQIIAHYLAKHVDNDGLASAVLGPARSVFAAKGLEETFVECTEDNIEEVIEKIRPMVILTGTSWTTGFELRAIRKAKELGIPSATYLEHWVHFKERFGYPREGWKDNLPDELWVGDKEALKMAEGMDFGKKIIFMENEYFKSVEAEYKKFLEDKSIQEQKSGEKEEETILFISEPMSESINSMGDSMNWEYTEYDILENVLKKLNNNGYTGRFVIRMHPAEQKSKYNEVIEGSKGSIRVEVSDNKNFYVDIAPSKLVIGMESMGLVIPFLCGKRTISYLPNDNQSCPLPFEEIEKTKDINSINL